MSTLYTSASQSSLEWDYNDNHSQHLNYNVTQGSAAKRLFSWEFDMSDNSSGKFPRMDLDVTKKQKVVPYKDEFENFQKIMSVNIQQFKVKSVQLQNPVKQLSSSHNRISNAVMNIEKSNGRIIRLKESINISKETLFEVRKMANKFQTDTVDLDDKCKRLIIAVEEGGGKLVSLKTILENKDDLLKKAKQSISSEVSNLEKYLGLHLVNSTHGGIIFIFTNISRDNPSKKFCFELLLSNRRYKVTKCHPRIDNIEELVKFLNITDDLSGFVGQVRKKFIMCQPN